MIGQGKGVRLLAKLENFRGWEKTEQWADASFLIEHGNAIVKMAIVGDELRNTPVHCSRRSEAEKRHDTYKSIRVTQDA